MVNKAQEEHWQESYITDTATTQITEKVLNPDPTHKERQDGYKAYDPILESTTILTENEIIDYEMRRKTRMMKDWLLKPAPLRGIKREAAKDNIDNQSFLAIRRSRNGKALLAILQPKVDRTTTASGAYHEPTKRDFLGRRKSQ